MAKRKFRLNIFDIVIVLIVAVIAVGLYVFTHRETVVETKKLIYTIELRNVPEGFTNLVKEGDELTDGVKNYNMGKVLSAERQDFKLLSNDYNTNTILDSVVPEKETCVIRVEADVTETAMDYKVNGNFLVKAGIEINVHGPGYAGNGYILSIDR